MGKTVSDHRRTLEEQLAELFERAYNDEDFEVADRLLQALEVIIERDNLTIDLMSRLRGFPAKKT